RASRVAASAFVLASGPFPAAAGWAVAEAAVAAAIDDVRAGQVTDRRGGNVHKAAERPERDERPSGQDVELVADRGLEDERAVRMQVENGTEPGRDGEPVVVRVSGQRADHRGAEAEQDRGHEQHIHRLVVASGSHEYRTDGSPTVDQDD